MRIVSGFHDVVSGGEFNRLLTELGNTCGDFADLPNDGVRGQKCFILLQSDEAIEDADIADCRIMAHDASLRLANRDELAVFFSREKNMLACWRRPGPIFASGGRFRIRDSWAIPYIALNSNGRVVINVQWKSNGFPAGSYFLAITDSDL